MIALAASAHVEALTSLSYIYFLVLKRGPWRYCHIAIPRSKQGSPKDFQTISTRTTPTATHFNPWERGEITRRSRMGMVVARLESTGGAGRGLAENGVPTGLGMISAYPRERA